jgi:hypothetical protein
MDAEKIVRASWGVDSGIPLKDFLTDEEIEEAVHRLADILMITGTEFPDE